MGDATRVLRGRGDLEQRAQHLAAGRLPGHHRVRLAERPDGVAHNATGTNFTWIGLNDIAVDGTFEWDDGTAVSYTNWTSDLENHQQRLPEDCTVVQSNLSYQWNDAQCALTTLDGRLLHSVTVTLNRPAGRLGGVRIVRCRASSRAPACIAHVVAWQSKRRQLEIDRKLDCRATDDDPPGPARLRGRASR